MNKTQPFEFLKTCNPSALLSLLNAAYDALGHDQRQGVFGQLAKAQPPIHVDGEALLDKIEGFRRESLVGVYYAPFAINSNNWMHVPGAHYPYRARSRANREILNNMRVFVVGVRRD